ncbi:radical SAM family heme chaperone HemW [Ruminococcaceae bacterium OttesenSCG-928-I18]|nr:radical SAM family heme chaperone HemW [Ruminococcaceae bacterium OttesenSCG-928-I18]
MTEGEKTEYGLYLHIPFCRSRCHYCDFHTKAGFDSVPQEYVDALLRAFETYRPRTGRGEPLRPMTVYFGGGTPSLLSASQVESILRQVNPMPGAEVTLEANPAANLAGRWEGWRKAGVNRLSFGVQSASDASLERLGRAHGAQEARLALRRAGQAGFENLSGDIMLALPEYSHGEFDQTLELLVEGGVSHVSAYLLKVEPGTPFGKRPPEGLPGADAAAEQYLYAVERLRQAGYPRYEISNYAKPGRESRHNLLYWDCRDYLGLGAAAHSCLFGRRFSFAEDTDAFVAGDAGVLDEGKLTGEEYLMLRLRLEEGVVEKQWEERFQMRLSMAQKEWFVRFEKEGLARKTPGGWALTSRGMLVQNSLLAVLLA